MILHIFRSKISWNFFFRKIHIFKFEESTVPIHKMYNFTYTCTIYIIITFSLNLIKNYFLSRNSIFKIRKYVSTVWLRLKIKNLNRRFFFNFNILNEIFHMHRTFSKSNFWIGAISTCARFPSLFFIALRMRYKFEFFSKKMAISVPENPSEIL